MQTIRCWEDLSTHGIIVITQDACALSHRILCDVTARGKWTLERALSVRELLLDAPEQPGSSENPHVGSIMLAPGMLAFLALFCLLDGGACEVLQTTDHRMTGFDHADLAEVKASFEKCYHDEVIRHFECSSPAWKGHCQYRLDRLA